MKMSGVWGTTKVWSKPYSKNLFIETFSKNYFNTQWFYIQPNYSFLPVFVPNFLSLANKGQLSLNQTQKFENVFVCLLYLILLCKPNFPSDFAGTKVMQVFNLCTT